MDACRAFFYRVKLYLTALGKWVALAVVTGFCCGILGALFHMGVELATEYRTGHPWLLWLLPAAALVAAVVAASLGGNFGARAAAAVEQAREQQAEEPKPAVNIDALRRAAGHADDQK